MPNYDVEPHTEILTTYTFTTLEGLYQAIGWMSAEFPGINRGQVYLEDRDAQSIGRLKLRLTIRGDGSYAYEAVLALADDKDEIR